MVAVQRVAMGSILLYLCKASCFNIFSSPTYHILEEVAMANFRVFSSVRGGLHQETCIEGARHSSGYTVRYQGRHGTHFT